MSGRQPLVRSQALAACGGVAALAVAAILLRDAWEGRGLNPPWPVRAVSFW